MPIEIAQMLLSFFSSVGFIIFGKVKIIRVFVIIICLYQFVPNPTPVTQQIFIELVLVIVYFPLILSFLIKNGVDKQ